MKVVTICGSLKYKDEMLNISKRLSLEGYCVLTPLFVEIKDISNKDIIKFKEEHFKRIEISDAIFVVNINNYIGESTKNEINYAKSLNKEIIYYEV